MNSATQIQTNYVGHASQASGLDYLRYITSELVMKPSVMPRILLVDDDPVYGKVMQRVAKTLGAPLEFAQSLEDLSDARLEAFDVAIVDFDLGAVTGLELTRYLDHRRPMPIVLVSQSQRRPDRRWSESIHDFLLKTAGAYAVFDAAFEAHEIARLHDSMRKQPRRPVQ